MKKLIITGPECSGKSTLARKLVGELSGLFVPEYARPYLSVLSRDYVLDDLVWIAKGQKSLEEGCRGLVSEYLICDTSMLVLKIWSHYRYGFVAPYIENAFLSDEAYLYVLCTPDLQWKADDFRENQKDRWSLFYLYHKALIEAGKPFEIVEGSLEQRLQHVKKILRQP